MEFAHTSRPLIMKKTPLSQPNSVISMPAATARNRTRHCSVRAGGWEQTATHQADCGHDAAGEQIAIARPVFAAVCPICRVSPTLFPPMPVAADRKKANLHLRPSLNADTLPVKVSLHIHAWSA